MWQRPGQGASALVLKIITGILAVSLLVMCWQEIRFRRLRYFRAQDYQRVFHAADAFHVMVFFRLRGGDRLVETARLFTQHISACSRARLIYAGQAAFSIDSEQLGHRPWDGVLLYEYPSRSDYQASCEKPRSREALSLFADCYQHAMRRNRKLSGSMPQFLLRVRLKDIFTGKWRIESPRISQEFETFPEFQSWRDRVSRLRAAHEVNRQALVVFNLVKFPPGSGEAAVEAMGGRLLSNMAAVAYGPLHIGRPVALEQFARFDRAYVVYYPSAQYFAELLSSQYFSNIASPLQMTDAILVPTVPVTARVKS